MSRRTPKGFYFDSETKRGSCDKTYKGRRYHLRLQGRTKEEALLEFYKIMAAIKERIRQEEEGILTFRDAALRYINEKRKRSIARDITTFEILDPFIGHLSVDKIYNGALVGFFEYRRNNGIKHKTIVRDVAVIRLVLKYVQDYCRNNLGERYIKAPVRLEYSYDEDDSATPYPLSGNQEDKLFKYLPDYLRVMAIFAVNTGVREQVVCHLKWQWEVEISSLGISVFIVPDNSGDFSNGNRNGGKSKVDQLIVLNKEAKKVIDSQRGLHDELVFPYKGRQLGKMNNSAWKTAWKKAELPTDNRYLRGPHNLKHTFGWRLSLAGVSLVTRKQLLHHVNKDVTLIYSPVMIDQMLRAAEKAIQKKYSDLVRLDFLNQKKAEEEEFLKMRKL